MSFDRNNTRIQKCSLTTTTPPFIQCHNKEQKRNVNLFINEQCDYNIVEECNLRDVESEKVCMFVQRKMMAAVTSDQKKRKSNRSLN